MNFVNEQHKERFKEALRLSGAVGKNGNIDGDFGASLFLLAGLDWVYPRIKRFITKGQLDFEGMLGLGLSSGESMAVEFAGNLYNGRFFVDYTPLDLIVRADDEVFSLVMAAFVLRRQKLHVSALAA
jgi:hypothetical protein